GPPGTGFAGVCRIQRLPSMSARTALLPKGGRKSGSSFGDTTDTSRIVGGFGTCARFGIGCGMHEGVPLGEPPGKPGNPGGIGGPVVTGCDAAPLAPATAGVIVGSTPGGHA